MRYAIISDVHSNYEALTAVLEDIRKQKVDDIICLGDIVGYGASPKECINLIKQCCSQIIIGNHDHAAIGLTDTDYFNFNARNAIKWTSQQLTDEEKEYFSNLPFYSKRDDLIFTHASLYKPQDWGYILDEYQALASFEQMKDSFICFIGHSHVPLAFIKKQYLSFMWDIKEFVLEKNNQYIINVGSVGQPRDGIKDAAYVIYDSSKLLINLIRVSYDIETAQKKIIGAGLPKFLAERIQYGR
ncbi:hypothetical protein BVX93_01920 [bacterium B13(2017)]|nr:hypothetical protein BVX93_01920 [bacterium B13(2017)]